jgi:rabenosyn-5
MAARKLGGGRILGSGKSLAPPPAPAHNRSSSLLSISETVISAGSESSSLPASHLSLTENIRGLGDNGRGTEAADASNRLICPICNEEMVGLLVMDRKTMGCC